MSTICPGCLARGSDLHHPQCPYSHPAQPASTLDTSPPSRTSNAASENGAASLLALIESVDKYFSITNRTYPQVEITPPEWQLIKSALQQVHPIAPPPLPEPAIRAPGIDDDEPLTLCDLCGNPTRYGSRHVKCAAARATLTLSETKIRSRVYGCSDAKCVCGRCAPVRFAVDPWQGLGKTWSDK